MSLAKEPWPRPLARVQRDVVSGVRLPPGFCLLAPFGCDRVLEGLFDIEEAVLDIEPAVFPPGKNARLPMARRDDEHLLVVQQWVARALPPVEEGDVAGFGQVVERNLGVRGLVERAKSARGRLGGEGLGTHGEARVRPPVEAS